MAEAVRAIMARLRQRPVLLAALVAGGTAGSLAGLHLRPSTAILVGWCVAAAVHTAVELHVMARATPEVLH